MKKSFKNRIGILCTVFVLTITSVLAQNYIQKNPSGKFRIKPSEDTEKWNDLGITISDEAKPYFYLIDVLLASKGDTISVNGIELEIKETDGIFHLKFFRKNVQGVVYKDNHIFTTGTYYDSNVSSDIAWSSILIFVSVFFMILSYFFNSNFWGSFWIFGSSVVVLLAVLCVSYFNAVYLTTILLSAVCVGLSACLKYGKGNKNFQNVFRLIYFFLIVVFLVLFYVFQFFK